MAFESIILGLNLYTQHFSNEIPYNKNTTGIYLLLDDSITVGTVKNCLGKRSNYLGYSFNMPLDTKLTLGGITGYSSLTHHTVSPMILLSKNIGPVRLTFIPKNPAIHKSSGAISFSIEKEWK